MSEDYRPTLAVHCAWHPRLASGSEYGAAIFASLFEDPQDLASHGLRIPVRLWTADTGVPPLPPLTRAARNAVVVLVDAAFVSDPSWIAWLGQVADALGPDDRLLPVSIAKVALDLKSDATKYNFIRLHDVDPANRTQVLLNRLTHALCRMTSDDASPVKVFISHAKADGEETAKKVRDFLNDGSGLQNFFDAQDILEGDDWATVLREAAARRHVLLAIRTDAYSTREWCRTEILEAKLGGAAVVVLDALDSMEIRGFPYLGNAPSVRWSGDVSRPAMERVLGVMLKETLRFRHFPLRVADICKLYGRTPPHRVLATPPELLTVLAERVPANDATGLQLVYPDPPLGTHEIRLVTDMAPHLEPLTPTALVARR